MIVPEFMGQLAKTRAPDRAIGEPSTVLHAHVPTCPSIAQGAPLAGLGPNPGVEDLPHGCRDTFPKRISGSETTGFVCFRQHA